jgi:hypothetical protein
MLFAIASVGELKDPYDNTLAFIKVIFGLISTLFFNVFYLLLIKGYMGMRSKLMRQEMRMIIGTSAFSAMSSLTWLSAKHSMDRENVNDLKESFRMATLLPLTFSLIVNLLGVISAFRIVKVTRRFSARLQKTVESLNIQQTEMEDTGTEFGEIQRQQKQTAGKYKSWLSASKLILKISALVAALDLNNCLLVIWLENIKPWSEILVLIQNRILLYIIVMIFWRNKVFFNY